MPLMPTLDSRTDTARRQESAPTPSLVSRQIINKSPRNKIQSRCAKLPPSANFPVPNFPESSPEIERFTGGKMNGNVSSSLSQDLKLSDIKRGNFTANVCAL